MQVEHTFGSETMRIAIATDAWKPQKNGVVRTLGHLKDELRKLNHVVRFIRPERYTTIPFPAYPEIPLALDVRLLEKTTTFLDGFTPDAVHICTEGLIGLAVRHYCLKHKLPFTTSYHTMFPEYAKEHYAIPPDLVYPYFRWFHKPAVHTMVSSVQMADALTAKKFKRLVIWPRGVDTETFHPRPRGFLTDPRPISMYAGRVSDEKNLEAFLRLQLPGTKYVVGDGPQLDALKVLYPKVKFSGHIADAELLSNYYSAADVFVFPSRTDTLGLVMIEAQACGTPVAAFPVLGPSVLVKNGINGYLDEDLARAVQKCLSIDREGCRVSTFPYTWHVSAEAFVKNLAVR